MSKSESHADRSQNRFLARLPASDSTQLSGLLKPVSLVLGQILYEADKPIEYAYFPTGAALSALTVMRDGTTIEVATVGTEGLVGHHGFQGRISPHRVVAQIAGDALQIASRVLEDEAARVASLQDHLMAYHVVFLSQVSQSVACNGLHRLEQRCCRWLLMSRDRIGSDEIKLTHEYLAMILGARRASVTDALRPLQEAGLVRSTRGMVLILDGPGLEARACECYSVVRDRYDRLLGVTGGGF